MPGMNIYQVLLAFTSIYYIQALPLHVSNDLELHESSAAFTGSIFTVKPVKSTGSSPKPKPVTLPVKKDCDNEWTKCVYETFDMRHCSNEKRKCLGKGEVQEWLQLADREEAEKPAEEEDEEAPEGEDDEAPEEEDDEGFEEIQEQLDNPNETGEGSIHPPYHTSPCEFLFFVRLFGVSDL